jgi:hypothetical protein
MRKTVRLFREIGPEERLSAAIAQLPGSAQGALEEVAAREDLPLVAGSWHADGGGCLVANVVRVMAADPEDHHVTLDLRVLHLFPELSSLDLNRLIVAWDEAAVQEGRSNDAALRRLLRSALARAGVGNATARGLAGASLTCPGGGSQDRGDLALPAVAHEG